MEEKLNQIKEQALAEIKALTSLEELEEVRVKFLGKNGQVTEILSSVGQLEPKMRPVIGKLANQIKGQLQGQLKQKRETLKEAEKLNRLEEETIDVTLPGKSKEPG